MIRTLLLLLAIAYLPGALVFRLPLLDRARRAGLPAEERAFWAIVLSVVQSSVVAFVLAAAARYQFERLLLINGTIGVLILLVCRTRLLFGASARRPTIAALLPLALVVSGLWINFLVPPAEYVMGGKDPGVYINEGIQIAQRGALVVRDEVVASVPAPYRGLFFRESTNGAYYSNRFMGFFLLDPRVGSVVGQFPHLYPTWIAVGYGIDGLSGARDVPGVFGALGLLAIYFLGARILGRPAAAAGAALVAINVVQVWYARYPSAEIVLQPLVFAALLAQVRAQADEDRFFAPVASLLLVLCLLTHLTGALAVVGLGVAAVIAPFSTRTARFAYWVPLTLGTALAGLYLATYIPPYFNVPIVFITTLGNILPSLGIRFVPDAALPTLNIFLIVLGALACLGLWRSTRHIPVNVRVRFVLTVLIVGGLALAAYAYFFRKAGGLLAEHDAESLRHFASFYLTPFGLALAVLGFALAARLFPAGFAFFLTAGVFSLFTFFKIRIVPEHFWAARRFLAVILPSALLFVGAAAFADLGRVLPAMHARAPVRILRYALGLVAVVWLGWHFFDATRPVLRHVEYAGLIPRLEQIASTIGDDDLAIVESRAGSDVHVLALPLAYIYARHVLVLAETGPDKAVFREFLTWAETRYRRVFFIGGGGTELLSRTMTVRPIRGERFQIPEYESALNAYPKSIRRKEFDLGIYEFLPQAVPAGNIDLDVGTADDLYVRRFNAKEQNRGFSFRWTRDVSFISIVGARSSCRELTVWLSGAARPPAAGPATVDFFLNDRPLGSVTATVGVEPYRFAIPPDLAASLEQSEDAAQLRLASRTWNPRKLLNLPDDRDLGVMVDRVAMDCSGQPVGGRPAIR